MAWKNRQTIIENRRKGGQIANKKLREQGRIHKFSSEASKAALKKRWDAYRAKKALEELNKGESNGV